jgi:hypothetical protein
MMMRAWTILFGCALLAPAVWGQGQGQTTTVTTSTAEFDKYNTTNVTQQLNTYQVELKARMQGGAYLFDQTYNVAFTDPSITTAIAQAKSALTGAGAVSFTGPTQLSSTQSRVSSLVNTVQTGSQSTGTPNRGRRPSPLPVRRRLNECRIGLWSPKSACPSYGHVEKEGILP